MNLYIKCPIKNPKFSISFDPRDCFVGFRWTKKSTSFDDYTTSYFTFYICFCPCLPIRVELELHKNDSGDWN